MKLYIGIDAGGSGVRALLGTPDGEILTRSDTTLAFRLVGSVPHEELLSAWRGVLKPLVNAVRNGRVVHVHAGMSGISISGTREAFEAAVRDAFSGATCEATSDAEVAALGALAGQCGVAVIAGTGSIALAGDRAPYASRAGGYGYLLGDEGSGFWIGRRALVAALSTQNRPLSELICQSLQLASVQDAVPWLYSRRQPAEALAELAPLVAQAAEQRDAAALEILTEAGTQLADLAASAAHRAWPTSLPRDLDVACCGGVWRARGQLEAAFRRRLKHELPDARVGQPQLPPVGGALLAAIGHGEASSDEAVKRLRQSV